MARHDLDPEDRDREPLTLAAVVTCPSCVTDIDVVFQAAEGVFEVEDLTDPPSTDVTCPVCDHEWVAVYEGWTAHEDAG